MEQPIRHLASPRALLLLLSLILVTLSTVPSQAQNAAVTQGQDEPYVKDADTADPATTRDADAQDLEFKRRWFKLLLVVLIFVIATLFGTLLAITLVRQGRWRRRRLKLNVPPGKTEYIDAWSQYRLKEEDIPRNDDPDTFPDTEDR